MFIRSKTKAITKRFIKIMIIDAVAHKNTNKIYETF